MNYHSSFAVHDLIIAAKMLAGNVAPTEFSRHSRLTIKVIDQQPSIYHHHKDIGKSKSKDCSEE